MPTNPDAVTLDPQAQKGLDYLKTANPDLASSILSTGGFNQIDATKLTGGSQFNLPTYAPPTTTVSTAPPPIDFGIAEKQSAVDTSLADLKSVEDQQGQETARRTQLEGQYNVPGINSTINELYAKDANYAADLSNLDSRELQTDLTSEDRYAPTTAISGEQAQAARQKAFQAQSVNIQRATNAAAITAAQGRLSLAQDYITKALDAEFKPLAAKIDYLKSVLSMNEGRLSDAEKAQIQQKIAENQRAYDEGTQNKNDIYAVLTTAAKYNAPASVLAKITAAPNREAAIAAAGTYIQDPKAKYDLEAARLDNILKQAQIDKTRKETAQIGQPTATERAASEKAVASAKAAIPVAKDKLSLIQSLITSPGLAGTVGPNPLARSAPDFNFFTGVRQDFIAGVNQLTNQETLDELLSLKAQGGSLGALSDSEGALLRQAASKIGSWAIHDKEGNVTGYNTTEASMKSELGTMQTLTQRALDNALGQSGVVTPDEKATIKSYLSTPTTSTTAAFNPASYF